MCDYSLHAMATRPAVVGETLISTTFRGTSTRGFASEKAPEVAVCMLPGTELAFAQDVKYDSRWIWTKTIGFRVGMFNAINPHVRERHHDAIEFPDGSYVLAGELYAETLPGFASPTPLALLKEPIAGRKLIYSTTNGTVAARRS